jgi:hypothetical protein
MAEFIAMMRMEEAAADEEDFWRTNHLRRWQRDWRVFWDTSKVSVFFFTVLSLLLLLLLL